MLQPFLSALLYEMLTFMGKHQDLFEKTGDDRAELLKLLKVPEAFRQYLSHISEKHFVADVKLVLQVLNVSDLTQVPVKGTAFFKALVEFFIGPFAGKLDQLPSNYALQDHEALVSMAKQLIPGESRTAMALHELIVHSSYQEIAGMIENLTKAVSDASLVLVQVPREVEADLKKEMRAALLEEYPHSFPTFQINRGLLGGFRIFVNGRSLDHSWFSRIARLTSLKTVS